MYPNIQRIVLIVFASVLFGCTANIKTSEVSTDSTANLSINMQKEFFGKTPEGRDVYRYVIRNKNGVEVHVINWGGIITHLRTPDRNGVIQDVVLGYDSLDGYLKSTPYFGAIVGRYGNRIAHGKFTLDGQEYSLVQNNNGHHLHGGTRGFDKVFWEIEPIGQQSLRLSYLSKDMEEGYPGNLDVTVIYNLTDENALEISYEASTDKKTIVNLTQHTYFNLTGDGKRDILDHMLQLNADRFIPVDDYLIPTGALQAVQGTPFDFQAATAVGERINSDHPQLKVGGGYDHCWVLNDQANLKKAASLFDPSSGRVVEVLTTEPGLQFYSGNFLDGAITGKNGVRYTHRFGLCLETEHFPDSPNRPAFPSVTLAPGQVYKTQTIYRFSTR